MPGHHTKRRKGQMDYQERKLTRNKLRVTRVLIAFALVIGVAIGAGRPHRAAAPMTTYIVTNTDDSGVGSLRQAILDANLSPGKDSITFSVTGTITLTMGEPVTHGDLDIAGPGATSLTVSGNNVDRVFNVGDGTVTISGLTISNGNAVSDGGGVTNDGTLTISHSTVSGNSTRGSGGGIENRGTLTIINSTVSDNSATGSGGIDNAGQLTIINSTLSANSATGGQGGGISNRSSFSLTLINSTVSGNSSSLNGGGIRNNGVLRASNCTVTGNSAPVGGGIYIVDSMDTVTIKNSIVANNLSGGNCANPNNGAFNAVGRNLSTDDSCKDFKVVTLGQLNLGALTVNAPGLTATHALGPGSVAIDAVDDCTDVDGNPVTADQRGVGRPQDGDGDGVQKCDAGAFEVGVRYNFTGFFSPVSNPTEVNVVKAGRAIPVKFSLGGDQGLGIFAQGFPVSGVYTCNTDGPASEGEQTVTAGNSGLSYDAASDQYSYVWKTQSSWAGSCRQLVVKLNDGSTHVANFQFK